MHKNGWKLPDSQVTLHWINCTKSALKMFVRNRVVESSSWWYVNSRNMIVDLGTRKGVKLKRCDRTALGYKDIRG